MIITPEILKEFIRQSLSPEFLKDKEIRSYYDILDRLTIYIDRQGLSNLAADYDITYDEGTIFLREFISTHVVTISDNKNWSVQDISISLFDPKASEKLREFFEKGAT